MNSSLPVGSIQAPIHGVDDERLITMWLHDKSENTRDAYLRDVFAFSDFVDVPFTKVTLADLQAYDASLSQYRPATRARKLSSIKSLLSFGHQIGYLRFNVGATLKAPISRDTLAERILDERTVSSLIYSEPDIRNRLILSLLYYAGLRVSELCGLSWRDVQAQRGGVQITVFGKGGQTRSILLPGHFAVELHSLSANPGPDEPVFPSSKTGKHLHRSQVYRVVRRAAKRIGLSENVSPHWLRHAHASHALDNGAPTHLVQQTLGHRSLATTGRYAHARPRDSSARFIRTTKKKPV